MQLNKLNNIVFLKDMESNIIEEAFVILKDNVKFNNFQGKTNKFDGKQTLLNEVEVLINTELKVNELKFESFKLKKLSKKYRILKFINVVLIAIIVFSFFI